MCLLVYRLLDRDIVLVRHFDDWKCYCTLLERSLAAKDLSADFADSATRSRFDSYSTITVSTSTTLNFLHVPYFLGLPRSLEGV